MSVEGHELMFPAGPDMSGLPLETDDPDLCRTRPGKKPDPSTRIRSAADIAGAGPAMLSESQWRASSAGS
jgi:hypothetical protein